MRADREFAILRHVCLSMGIYPQRVQKALCGYPRQSEQGDICVSCIGV